MLIYTREQQAIDSIARSLHTDDPAFAARLRQLSARLDRPRPTRTRAAVILSMVVVVVLLAVAVGIATIPHPDARPQHQPAATASHHTGGRGSPDGRHRSGHASPAQLAALNHTGAAPAVWAATHQSGDAHPSR